MRSHRPCTIAALLTGRVTSHQAAGPVARSVNEEALECASCEAIGRVLTLPPSRVGLLHIQQNDHQKTSPNDGDQACDDPDVGTGHHRVLFSKRLDISMVL